MTIIKKIINFILEHKVILGINYHRIGKKNLDDPFKGLHSVSLYIFKIQVLFIKYFFKILSLNDIQLGKVNNKINFFITFDDVPSSSMEAFNWLHEKKIPFTICPNISIIENKFTIGDKVRFIQKFLDKEKIENKLKNKLNEQEFNLFKNIGLKKFYKSYEINQLNFSKIFNDFFKEFEKDFEKFKINKNYLNWEDVSDLSKICSVASHGKNHENYFHLDYDKIYNEMESSKKIFNSNLNKYIKIFAVPYGEYNQNLGIMLNLAARKLDYKQILWIGNQAIIYSGKKKYQVQNLSRINAPSNFFTFIKTLIYSFIHSSVILKDDKLLKLNYDKKFQKFEIKNDVSKDQIAAFENTIRPEKDYSSNENFIERVYINNPYREEKPHNFSIVRNNILNAIHYNLYKKYKINKNTYTILESSGWRKLKSTPANINITLLMSAIRTCKSIYSWRPSASLAPGYKKDDNFFTIDNREFLFKPKMYNIEDQNKILITDFCPKYIAAFLEKFNQKFYFTLERSIMFYKWRIDNYPLGEKKYFIKKDNNNVSSILVSQILKKKALIVDLLSDDIEDSVTMIQNFLNYCVNKEILHVKFSTSNKGLIKKINEKFNCKFSDFESFIYIKNLINENIIERELLKKNESYETYVSGDVLIR